MSQQSHSWGKCSQLDEVRDEVASEMSKVQGLELAQADAFAAQVLARVAPLAFGVARSSAQLEAIYALRCRVVIEQGWGRPEDLPDGLERDAFDEDAVQIAGWDGGELIGTTRLVAPEPGRRLPTEQAFELDLASRGRVIDMGRTCRVPGQRDAGQRIFWGLLARSWLELRARGFAEICGSFAPGMRRLYERLGFRVQPLGPPRLYWGEEREPVLVRPAETIKSLRFASLQIAAQNTGAVLATT